MHTPCVHVLDTENKTHHMMDDVYYYTKYPMCCNANIAFIGVQYDCWEKGYNHVYTYYTISARKACGNRAGVEPVH